MITNENGLRVNEIYKSYQGEGKYQGCECVFIRLAYCDLKCTFCDTPYTWDWQNYNIKQESHLMSHDEIYDKLSQYQVPHIVITGGEPLLQQGELTSILHYFKVAGCLIFVEIETNGMTLPNLTLRGLVDQWNVSPKTSNSGNTHVNLKKAYNFVLPKWNNISNVIFKFVVKGHDDFIEINQYAKLVDHDKIWIMPEGKTKEEILQKDGWIYEMCRFENYKFTSRQHIIEYGNKRGV